MKRLQQVDHFVGQSLITKNDIEFSGRRDLFQDFQLAQSHQCRAVSQQLGRVGLAADARLTFWCSTSELTSLMASGQKPCSEQSERNPFECPDRRWTDDINAFNLKRRRWESNPLDAALQEEHLGVA